ncbi:MAG: nucleotidyltransferase [Chitinophagaceae bacterium]
MSIIEIGYVFQELDSFIGERQLPEGRTKPWGTAHAVLCAKEIIKEPFAVINADDFYGRDSFEKAYHFLVSTCSDQTWAIIGYELTKTLSDHGTVNRGVCKTDVDGNLASVVERLNISMTKGIVSCDDQLQPREIPSNSIVSMNFWCFSPYVFQYSQDMFYQFLDQHMNEPKSEFFIPIVADSFIKEGKGNIKVIATTSLWFGVTYKQDAPYVKKSIDSLIEQGIYPSGLWK